jgi:hypothetical protein
MMDNSGILLKENGSENVKNILANGNDEKWKYWNFCGKRDKYLKFNEQQWLHLISNKFGEEKKERQNIWSLVYLIKKNIKTKHWQEKKH